MAATAAAVVVRPVTPVQASLWSDAWRRLRRNRLALGGTIYLTFLVAVALIALVWTPYPMAGVAVAAPYSGPSPAHWFGADLLGRDVLSRVMVGAQISL
ncbi:MAG TPA: ABC transporter permease, partial [Methylomirabilota bacterium]|nr:ABC transporter permease [Methylomirabilota bacterium]